LLKNVSSQHKKKTHLHESLARTKDNLPVQAAVAGTDQRTKRLEVLLPVGPVFDELLDVTLCATGADAVLLLPYKVLEFLIFGFAPLPYSRGRAWLLVAT
jgi:hypothetical protein